MGRRDVDPAERKQGRRKRVAVRSNEHCGVARGPWSTVVGNSGDQWQSMATWLQEAASATNDDADDNCSEDGEKLQQGDRCNGDDDDDCN
ncbi:hypothetical protein B296_00042527 [Ensete ventricosum]|uniref:Uncharacterized protein n=1 Tax=Ensete ventricosum TaxID=4639 RepID=A0A426ZI06_ENSVE|nr:hypothetical protein B296_00042527 [Ensete ventricosum]